MPTPPSRTVARLLAAALVVTPVTLGSTSPTSATSPSTWPAAARSAPEPPVIADPVPKLEPPTPAARTGSARAAGRLTATRATDPLALHSRPGSPHTVYLDFDGADLGGTKWAELANTPDSTVVSAYDADGRPGLSPWEASLVEGIWHHVAEDFAPFDVDVTTEEPPSAALSRSSAGDPTYGTSVVFAHDNWVRQWCNGCSGVAYVGVYSGAGTDPWRQALVFPDFMTKRVVQTYAASDIARVIGTTASHEVGHQLGLHHDGLRASSPRGAMPYNPGRAPWGPIMGSTSQALTRWAGPDAAYTDNPEDDLAIIASQLGLVPDELPTVPVLPGVPLSGVISSAGDTDTYLVTPLRRSEVVVTPDEPFANLDVVLEVTDVLGRSSLVAPVTRLRAGRLSGLGAATQLLPGGIYQVTVRGGETPGVGRYGSLGRYTVQLR
ncbi:zinc-dependent metalloprotease family protein [Nocardioides sp.]|uniref:zinc-dependent metalloprotease family protein n=1 Tax=Nocardioides sp. TaxID=35761 RepID=UPI00261A38FA|nr:zinc-dependent metalloprotease family protein [Nocardioides sp.]